jgi:signal transduction histidine kinase/DNA-binding response OmpR family regulator
MLHADHFMPHGFCLQWDPSLVLTFVLANIGVALAYFAIPIALIVFFRKRRDLPYPWMFLLFGLFITSCGITHLLKIVTLYKSYYWLEAIADAFTAVVSIITAILLWPLIPKALALPSPKELASKNEELSQLNEEYLKLNSELSKVNYQLKEARDKAIEASKLKSAFVANISHELRTPLSALLGMNELLKAQNNFSSEERELVQGIHESGQSLLAMVNDLLDLSKMEAGKLDITKIAVDIHDIIQETVQLFKTTANSKRITLNSHVDPRIPRQLFGDPVRIKQILVNLLGNAVKFTDLGGASIMASIDKEEPKIITLKIIVSDTGIGLSEEQINKIFHPFAQADSSTSRRYGGAGLGLTISKELAGLMGGEITVMSSEGGGSSFCLKVPLSRTNGATINTQSDSAHLSKEHLKGNILIVEDDSLLQQLVSAQMNQLGLTHTVVGSGTLALEEAGRSEFDLILMDCHLPGLDGFSVTRKIRTMEQSGKKRTPIIAMTAGAMAGDYDRCINAGMDDYLSKPYTLNELRRVLLKWLQMSPDKIILENEVGSSTQETSIALEKNSNASADSSPSVIDVKRFKELVQKNKIKQLINLLIKNTDNSISAIESEINSTNPTRLLEETHKLRGALSVVYANELRQITEELEMATRNGNNDSKNSAFKKMDGAFTRLKHRLEEIEAEITVQPTE